jgi:hypothetical protein
VLTVTDDTTGVPVCNAFLAADAGAGVGLYPCAGGEGCSGKCPYVVNDYGASGGTFSIEISAPGYGTFEVSNLRMQYCGCGPCPGPEEVSVKISMEATPLDAGTPD